MGTGEDRDDAGGTRPSRMGLAALLLIGFVAAAGALHWHQVHRRDDPRFTPQEQAWIAAHRDSIRVGSDPNYPPLDFVDPGGHPTGVAEDVLREVEARSGLRFQRVPFDSWAALLRAAERREVDVVKCAARTPERAAHLYFSPPFFNVPTVFVTRLDGLTPSPEGLAGKRLAVSKSYGVQAYLEQHYPASPLVPVRHDGEALLLASTGGADVAVSDLPTATYFIRKDQIANLRVVGETGLLYPLSIATRSDWPLLHSIVTKSLGTLSPEERTAILDDWIRLEVPGGVLSSARFWFAALAIAGGLCALWLLVQVWNHSLLRLVRRRTAELRAHEARLEQTVDERTHEVRERNAELQTALANIKTLRGILPICAGCKRIRNDSGYWEQVEWYVHEHSEADFSHGLCPECIARLYPELDALPEDDRHEPGVAAAQGGK